MPPIDDKELEDQVSSPDLADENVEGLPPETDDAASSAAAETGEANGDDLLSVVRDVVGDRREGVEPEAAAPPAEPEATVEEPEAPKEPDDEDYSDVPFHKHPRFQQLLRKEKASREDAQRYQNVQNFMDSQGLGSEEAADLLIIGGLMQTNPVEAWRRAKRTIQKLLIAAGEVLPPDLQQQVQSGKLNPQSAMAESRARALQNSVQATRSFEQQRNERMAQTSAHGAIVEAGHSWEAERRAKDPNFEAKLEPFKREMAYIQHQEGRPNSPQMMVDQFNRAYKAVNAAYKAPAAPAPRPATKPKPAIKPVMGGSVAGTPKPEDESDRDVIRRLTAARAS